MRRDKAAQFFAVFFEATQAILSSWSLREVLKLLVKRAVWALDAKGGSLRLLDSGSRRLELAASHLLSQRFLEKGPLDADQSIAEVLQGRSVVVQNAPEDPRVQYPQAMRAEGIDTILSVPVEAEGAVIGVLRLYSGARRDFTEEELEFAAALAEVGGLAIANVRRFEAQGVKLSALLAQVGVDLPQDLPAPRPKGRAAGGAGDAPTLKQFRALHEVARAFLSTRGSSELVDLVAAEAREATGVRGCSLRLVNETTGELDLAAACGLSDAFLAKGQVHADRSIGEALAGVPVLVDDVGSDPRVEYPDALAREGITSLLSVPILARSRAIGVLRLYSAEPRSYGPDELAFLSALAELGGIAMVNARLYEQTTRQLSFWEATLRYLDVEDAGEPTA